MVSFTATYKSNFLSGHAFIRIFQAIKLFCGYIQQKVKWKICHTSCLISLEMFVYIILLCPVVLTYFHSLCVNYRIMHCNNCSVNQGLQTDFTSLSCIAIGIPVTERKEQNMLRTQSSGKRVELFFNKKLIMNLLFIYAQANYRFIVLCIQVPFVNSFFNSQKDHLFFQLKYKYFFLLTSLVYLNS